MKQEKSALVLFTLSPEAEGRRKPLGLGRPEQAAAIYATFLDYLEEVCSDLPGVDLLLSTPGEPASSAPHPLPQRGSSFGESLRLAVEDAFSLGYERVVVIGNDAPEMSRSYIREAFDKLEASGPCSAVIGPARDGGYALLGLSSLCPEAFEAMPWGSSHVGRMTEERLLAQGFAVERLAVLDDIDTSRALSRFLARARQNALADLAEKISSILSTVFFRQPAHVRSLIEILLANFQSLRAPPFVTNN